MFPYLVLVSILAPALGMDKYIVGGEDVSAPGTYPWQASLQTTTRGHICGMVLISDRVLVTAAHCFNDSLTDRLSDVFVVLGMHSRKNASIGKPTRYEVDKVITHPGADWLNHDKEEAARKGYANDSALVYINSKANTTNPYIETVPMAKSKQDFIGNDCVITGWGYISGASEVDTRADILQFAQVTVFSLDKCKEAWPSTPFGDYHICVAAKDKKASACLGDSGGPLICKNEDSSWVLVGVTSFVYEKCDTSQPNVYASIPHFRDWIDSHINIQPAKVEL